MTDPQSFDEIDEAILNILAEDPRTPYSEIATRVAEEGHEMSTEGIRYRVANILETTTVFFLLDPQEVTWEIVRVALRATDRPGAKDDLFELAIDLPFWHVSRGLGSFDLFAVGSVPDVTSADDLVTRLREHEAVERADYMIVTERNRDMRSYVSMNYLPEQTDDAGE